jgi:transcriptional regulator GlxA family with amidase domain
MVPSANVEANRRFVDNGRIVTTAGVSAGIDGALHVLANMLGRRVDTLRQAIAKGFNQRWRLERDEDLASVRLDPRFADLLASSA